MIPLAEFFKNISFKISAFSWVFLLGENWQYICFKTQILEKANFNV